MQQPLQITFRDIAHSDAVEQRIRQKMEKLDRFFFNIISCKVAVGLIQKNQQQGKLYSISIYVSVPGAEFSATHHPNENLYLALQGAIHSMHDQLEEYRSRLYGGTKDHGEKLSGEVVRLMEDKDYGFISDNEKNEYYFNLGHLVNKHFDQLRLGDKVHFLPAMGHDGLQARRVSVLKK